MMRGHVYKVIWSISAFLICLGSSLLLRAAPPLLSLADCLKLAKEQAPALLIARTNRQAAAARVGEARANFLPQVTLTGNYQGSTSNFVPRPGSVPKQFTVSTNQGTSLHLSPYYNFGLTIQELIYDFGLSLSQYRSASFLHLSLKETETAALREIVYNVQQAYFNVAATKELLRVAKEALANEEKHLAQIVAFVAVGSKPTIDLAGSQASVANAKVQLLNAEANYNIAKATLNSTLGKQDFLEYEIQPEHMPVTLGEKENLEDLYEQALAARPELKNLARQLDAAAAILSSLYSNYAPALSLTLTGNETGTDMHKLTFNYNLALGLSWSIFQGGLTAAKIQEQKANITNLQAQFTKLKQDIRLQLEKARFTVLANVQALSASEVAVMNALERLRLAEGRYTAGAGNVIELQDAQLVATNALAQKIQAECNLDNARASLLFAVGVE